MSKGLEEIKTLRGFNKVELNNDKNITKSLDIIEDELKVLEILKEYQVDIEWFKMRKKWTETLENQYKSYCKYIENNSYWSSITEEEFNLLKRYFK